MILFEYPKHLRLNGSIAEGSTSIGEQSLSSIKKIKKHNSKRDIETAMQTTMKKLSFKRKYAVYSQSKSKQKSLFVGESETQKSFIEFRDKLKSIKDNNFTIPTEEGHKRFALYSFKI